MKIRSVAPMRIAKIGYIVMSVLFCLAGIFFIMRPDVSASAIGIGAGTVLIIFGLVKLVGYFSKDLYRLAFQYDLEFGILLLILGVIVLLKPRNLMTFICVVLGISILLDGLFKIHIALDSREFGIQSWGLILAAAVITVLLGAVLVFDAVKGAGILTVLLGISLLSEGILNLCTVIATVLIVKNQKPDVVEVEYYEVDEKER